MLKVLEGETEETIVNQLKLFHERALPDLANNIKCGNSLIGPDFYENQQMDLFNEEERYRINAFNWNTEFPDIMQSGGFDAVIGNPPYGAFLSYPIIDYLKEKYFTGEYQFDTYSLFIEKAYYLCKSSKYIGVIIPSAWVASKYNKKFRQLISTKTIIKSIVINRKKTFINATVETLILILKKDNIKTNKFPIERWDFDERQIYFLSQEHIINNKDYVYSIYARPDIIKLLEKIKDNSLPLSIVANAVWGVKIYQKGKGRPKQKGNEQKLRKFHSKVKTKDTHKPLLGGSEIKRYNIDWKGEYVEYGEWLAEPRTIDWFNGSRIIVREVTDKGIIQATLVNDEFVFSNSADGIKLKNNNYKLEFILGIINSKLISFYHLNTSSNAFKGTFPKLLIKDLLDIPIPKIDSLIPDEQFRYNTIIQIVKKMLEFNKKVQLPKTDYERNIIQRQIEATDRQIDRLVYDLYRLTEEEISIIEKTYK